MEIACNADRASEQSILEQKKIGALAFDLGGTKIAAAMFDGHELISEVVKVLTPSGPEAIIEAFLKLISQFQERYIVTGIGIGTPGVIDTVKGCPTSSTNNLPGWSGTPIKRLIEEKTMISVYVENDAKAAAYGEAKSQNLMDSPCTIVITLGTGIGGGILLNGEVYHGFEYAAGHVGHIPISLEKKRLCTCGLFDCWEAYASGIGLTVTAREVLSGLKEEQTQLVKEINHMSAQKLVAAAEQGDPAAKNILALWHEHVCAGLAILLPIFDPEAFILSGGLSDYVDLPLLTELLMEKALPGTAQNLTISKSKLGINAGLIGAAHLILDQLAVAKS
jgi:glucokinase